MLGDGIKECSQNNFYTLICSVAKFLRYKCFNPFNIINLI